MRRTAGFAAAGVGAFLVFLVVLVPARFVARVLPDGVAASGWSGTIWSGRAQDLRIDGRRAGSATWSCRPWPLLRLEWSCRVSLELEPGSSATADLVARRDGSLTLGELRGELPIAAVAPDIAPGWDGRLELAVTRIEIRDRGLADATGSLYLRELVSTQGTREALGDFELQFGGGAVGTGALSGRLRDLGGPLHLRAVLELAPDRSWRVSGEVAPRPGASAALIERLAWLGPADPEGRRPLSAEGRW